MWWLLPPVLGAVAFVRTSVKRIQDADLASQVRNLIMDLRDHCCTLPGKGTVAQRATCLLSHVCNCRKYLSYDFGGNDLFNSVRGFVSCSN